MRKGLVMLVLAATFVMASLVFSGCTTYSALASHTIATGQNLETDVVWVLTQPDNTILRCTNTAQGPMCQQVGMQ